MPRPRYEELMTTEYDEQFRNVPELVFHPWVGRNYHETRILVVGRSVHKVDGEDWTLNMTPPLERKDASRVLVAGVEDADDEPFSCRNPRQNYGVFEHMFIEGCSLELNNPARAKFWSNVAFNNFLQVVVENPRDWPDDDTILEASTAALRRMIEILSPDLVLAWTTVLPNFGYDWSECQERERIFRDIPRAINGIPSIVGMLHPGWFRHRAQRGAATRRAVARKWFEFLRDEPASQEPIGKLIARLQDGS